mmetsp:Transcript_17426/g.48395  ORF Transcript_17426/g.48395 Transcript_17426/m.48395 type:complete len:204 (-) Transcript_17426:2253-2864(-)
MRCWGSPHRRQILPPISLRPSPPTPTPPLSPPCPHTKPPPPLLPSLPTPPHPYPPTARPPHRPLVPPCPCIPLVAQGLSGWSLRAAAWSFSSSRRSRSNSHAAPWGQGWWVPHHPMACPPPTTICPPATSTACVPDTTATSQTMPAEPLSPPLSKLPPRLLLCRSIRYLFQTRSSQPCRRRRRSMTPTHTCSRAAPPRQRPQQ